MKFEVFDKETGEKLDSDRVAVKANGEVIYQDKYGEYYNLVGQERLKIIIIEQ